MKNEAIKLKEKKLIEMTSSFCDENLDEEYKDLCVKVIQKLGRKHDVPFKRGKLEIWASGIIYALGQINFLFDKSFEPYASPDDICNYFSTKKSTVSNKARDIRDMLKMKQHDEEFLTKSIFESMPKYYLEPETGLILDEDFMNESLDNIFNVNDTDDDLDFYDEEAKKHLLDDTINYGKDYPSSCIDFDMFNILTKLKEQSNLAIALFGVEFETILGEDIIKDILIDEMYIKEIKSSDSDEVAHIIPKGNLDELCDYFRENSIYVSKEEENLIKSFIESVSEIEFDPAQYEITAKGEKFLKDYVWIDLYNHALLNFDYNEFSKYIDEHDGELISIALDFIDEHLKSALERDDSEYLIDCHDAKSSIYMYFEDYETALNLRIERFFLRVNQINGYENISNEDIKSLLIIKKICDKLAINDLKPYFTKIWNKMGSKEEWGDIDNAFELFMDLLNDESLKGIPEFLLDY